MKKASLTEGDWFFYGVLSSKHCAINDVRVLKNEYSLPEFLKLKEFVEMMTDLETATTKDNEEKQKI
jgi:hypothetical protein